MNLDFSTFVFLLYVNVCLEVKDGGGNTGHKAEVSE